MRKPLASAVVLHLLAISLSAQSAPPPATPPAPFTGYLGRFLDSSTTTDYFYPNRTLRTDIIKIDRRHDRIYIRAGYGYFIGYQLSTFASKLSTPLATGPHGELYLPWTMKVNAETDGWATVLADGAVRLTAFDFDDRGYIYLAYTIFGWGIVDSNGRLLRQVPSSSSTGSPVAVVTFASAGHQYAFVDGGYGSRLLYDVTDPTMPPRIVQLPAGSRVPLGRFAKNDAGDAIALVSLGQLLIYTPDQLVNNATPVTIQPLPGTTFTDVTTDGVNFYASQDGTSDFVSVISPVDGGYTRSELPQPMSMVTQTLTYGAGYLAWIGFAPATGAPVGVLFAFDGTRFTPTDISAYLQANYTNYPFGYLHLYQIAPYCNDVGAFALFADHGLGDAFSLTPAVAPCFPGAPSNVTATAGNASATVSFTPPVNDGGSPITSYTFTSIPDGVTATGIASPVTINGLVNERAYAFTVAANNSVGRGAQSDPSNSVTPSGPMPAPANLSMWVAATTQVEMTWTGSAGASLYEVLRSSMGSPFSQIGMTPQLYFWDSTVAPDTTYIYKVRALDDASNESPDSAIAIATTIFFTDDPLTPGTTALAVHIAELRTAVNAVRAAAALSDAVFTDPSLDSTITIQAVHITELRSALDEARSVLGLPALSFTDPTLTPGDTLLKAVHVQEIRAGVN